MLFVGIGRWQSNSRAGNISYSCASRNQNKATHGLGPSSWRICFATTGQSAPEPECREARIAQELPCCINFGELIYDSACLTFDWTITRGMKRLLQKDFACYVTVIAEINELN